MRRPVGVTILGVFMILAGAGFGIMGLLFFFMGSTGATASARTSGAMAALLAALGAAAGVIFLFFGALHIVLALGVFKLRNLARMLTILLFLVIAAGGCLGLIATLLSYSRIGLVWNVSLLGVDGLALWYLLRPNVKEAFSA